MFQWNNKDRALCEVFVTHVDDFVYCGTLKWHKNVFENYLCVFKSNKREKESLRYVELNVVQTCKEVFIDQNSLLSSLKLVKYRRSFTKRWRINNWGKVKINKWTIIVGNISDSSRCFVWQLQSQQLWKNSQGKNILEANKAV